MAHKGRVETRRGRGSNNLILLLKPPPKRRVAAERRALRQVAGALEIPDEPLCDDVGHECVGVVLALSSMSRVVKRSASPAVKSGPSRRGSPLPRFIPPQLSQPVEKPPSGPRWLHEIKLDGFRMAARIDHGRAQLLTRTGLDWTDPSVIAALANLNVKTAYIDGELCGVDESGLPSFAHTQAATDGERGVSAPR